MIILAGVGGIAAVTSQSGTASTETLVAEAAAALQARVPAQINDKTTVTRVQASGQELIQTMVVSRDIPRDYVPVVQKVDHSEVCGNKRYRALIDAGAVLRLNYTDADGDTFQSTVSNC